MFLDICVISSTSIVNMFKILRKVYQQGDFMKYGCVVEGMIWFDMWLDVVDM